MSPAVSYSLTREVVVQYQTNDRLSPPALEILSFIHFNVLHFNVLHFGPDGKTAFDILDMEIKLMTDQAE